MTQMHRCVLCAGVLTIGLVAQGELKRLNQTKRPSLRRDLASIPLELGDWVGEKEDVAPDIIERAQTTEYLNRVYKSRTQPGLQLTLWINYSEKGTNLRHTPEICLPSGGWTKIESQTKVLTTVAPDSHEVRITRLGYEQGELVKQVGFWYYIFGEGKLENFVRRLPITSRSSHGQTTRGSSMTVEIFYPGEHDPDGDALRDFTQSLLIELEPILPHDRAEYYVP
ncbi:MAG: EpsI family protein [Isosphaeraceae bacterium]